jgi:hypothetical protein
VTGRRLAACALAVVLAAGCAACTSGQPRPAARPSPAASSPHTTPAPAAGTPALAAILPFSCPVTDISARSTLSVPAWAFLIVKNAGWVVTYELARQVVRARF